MTVALLNREQLIARVQKELQYDPFVTSTIALEAITEAARKVAGLTKCLKTTWELSALASVTSGVYRIPDDFCALDRDTARWGDNELSVRYVSPNEFATLRNETPLNLRTSGGPDIFTIDGRNIKLYPVNNQDGVLKIEGAEFPDDLASNQTFPVPLGMYQEAIITQACKILSRQMGDKEEKDSWDREAKRELQDASTINTERTPNYVHCVPEYDD